MKLITYNNILFKQIKGYEKYYISKCGKVLSFNKHAKGKILKSQINNRGYEYLYLGRKNKYYVHRLIALVYLKNPENKKTVNHIDGNALNNNLNNLEWSTYKEQMRHAVDVLGVNPIRNIKRFKNYSFDS